MSSRRPLTANVHEEKGSIHHLIRRVTRWLPFVEIPTGIYGRRAIFDDLNILLGRLFFDREDPRWLSGDRYDLMPAMQLNVSSRLQRKIFYYPRAWGRKCLEAPLAQCMRSLLRPGDTFLDIGANLRIYSLFAASLVGREGQVLAFEPEIGIYESLLRTVELNALDQVECLPVALSDQNGASTLFLSWHGGANSLVPEPRRYRGSIQIQTRRVDDLLKERGIALERIRLMKIDVERAEARTVEGTLGTLMQAGCPALWIEVRGPKGSKRASALSITA